MARRDNLIYALARAFSSIPEPMRVISEECGLQHDAGYIHILRMEKYELYLPLEPQALDLTFRSALQRLCQGIPELLERVEVGRPVRICHQEQRSRVSRVVF